MADSIADRFIETMATIKALDALTDTSQPMWFQVHQMQIHAEQVLDNAIRLAWAISKTAQRLPNDAKEEVAEAVKAATQGTKQ